MPAQCGAPITQKNTRKAMPAGHHEHSVLDKFRSIIALIAPDEAGQEPSIRERFMFCSTFVLLILA
jgi:hypothetical protein